MRNERGQALVEFVLILPILLLILISMIDFGSLLYQKYQLEQKLDYISDLYLGDQQADIETEKRESHITVQIEEQKPLVKITVRKNANLSSPILRKILGNPYQIETSRKLLKDMEPEAEPVVTPTPSPTNTPVETGGIDTNVE